MKTKRIRVLIVDDHEIIRYGIKMLMSKTDDMQVVGECSRLKEASTLIKTEQPDVVLLDAKLSNSNVSEYCTTLKELAPSSKIILLTAYVDEDVILNGVLSGIDGYLVKNTSKNNVLDAIRAVSAGQSYIDSKIANKVLSLLKVQCQRAQMLSEKDAMIMDLICLGKTNKDIAKELFLAEKTIRNRVSGIFKKLQVKNRTEAALCWTDYKTKSNRHIT